MGPEIMAPEPFSEMLSPISAKTVSFSGLGLGYRHKGRCAGGMQKGLYPEEFLRVMTGLEKAKATVGVRP